MSKTYQLWGLVRGKPVSLALLGPDPREPGQFRVEGGTTKLMVTAEPAGGASLPTTAVLAAGAVPPAAMHI
jgi:anti-sigma-K factor RskA